MDFLRGRPGPLEVSSASLPRLTASVLSTIFGCADDDDDDDDAGCAGDDDDDDAGCADKKSWDWLKNFMTKFFSTCSFYFFSYSLHFLPVCLLFRSRQL